MPLIQFITGSAPYARARPDVEAAVGSPGLGFFYPTPPLPPGLHRASVYILDRDTLTATLVASRVFFTP
jgi:hypothetical protein